MSYLYKAAKWYAAEPHQIAAWDALEEQLPKSLINEFKTAYRAAPAAPAAVRLYYLRPTRRRPTCL